MGTWVTGVSKAGFGGGIGMFVLPLFTQFRTPKNAIALMLPLLFSTDVISLGHFWKQWHRKSILRLVPGSIIGIIIASFILRDISDFHLKKAIGGIVCLFALLGFLSSRIMQLLNPITTKQVPVQREPVIELYKVLLGVFTGIIAGIFSTLAHMAGPIIVMYLLPQKLGNRKFVATTTVLYFFINLAKTPVYYRLGLFSLNLFIETIVLLPFVALGVQVGVYLNNRFPERIFSKIVLIVLFVTGIHLLLT